MWKSGDGEHDRPGQPDKNSWDSLGKVDPHRGGTSSRQDMRILQGTKRLIHDRTGRPAVSASSKEQANFEKFIVGSDTTEFVNKVRRPSANIDRRECQTIAESCNEHSIIWGMFMVTTFIECGDIYGKEFLNYSKCCQES